MKTEFKTAVRSGLLRFPRAYEVLTSQRRYMVAYRLGLVHDRDFRRFPDLVPPDARILDVGANWGQSVLSIKRVLPRATVVSFEPNPLCHPALQRLAARFPQVSYQPFGLSDEEGEAQLYVPVYNGKVMSGLASFDRESAAGWLNAERVYGFDAGKLEIREYALPLRRLDDLDEKPDLIKIDVQGFEDNVVNGAWQTILEHRPALLIEAPSPETAERLSGHGYRLAGPAGDNSIFISTMT